MNNGQIKSFKKSITRCIIFNFIIMTASINFNNNLLFGTVKINNKISYDFLTIKINT